MLFIFKQHVPSKKQYTTLKSELKVSLVVLSHINLQNKLNSCPEMALKYAAFCLKSIIIRFIFTLFWEKLLFFLALLIFFVCLLSFYVFPSLDYIFHSAPFCFTSLLYCQFLKSAISRLEILHFSNIDCLIMSFLLISHFLWNSRMLLNSMNINPIFIIAILIQRFLLHLIFFTE